MNELGNSNIENSIWHGFKRADFHFNNRECIVVSPRKCLENRPWVWRAEFFGAFPNVDLMLLEEGWHIAYYQVSNMYGCPDSIDLLKKFHTMFIEKYHMNLKADVFGFSRGGLYAINYALKYPQDVSTLYLDAPVLDIRSWPAGYGKGVGGKNEWAECMKLYGLTEETAKSFLDNPVSHLDELIKTNIPVIIVAGDSDEVVPYEENGEILVNAFLNMNANIKVIVKKGIGHHPHSLDNPSDIVEFIKENRR